MNFIKKLLIVLVLLSLPLASNAMEEARSKWESEKPKDPLNKAQRDELAKQRDELASKVKKEEQDSSSKNRTQEQEEEYKLDAKKLDYYNTTIERFDFSKENISNRTPEDLKAENAAKEEQRALNNDIVKIINEQIQLGFIPRDGGTIQPQGPGFIEKITLNLNKIITNFRLDRAMAKNDVVKSGELSKKLTSIYDSLGKSTEGKKALDSLNAKYRVKENVLNRLQIYQDAYTKSQSFDLRDDITGYVNDYVDSLVKSEIEFGIKNKKNKEEVKKYYDDISGLFDNLNLSAEQKDRLIKFRDDSITQLEAQGDQANSTVKDFFDNKSSNNVKAINEQFAIINKRIKEEASHTSTLKDLESLETVLQEFSAYAQYQLDSINPLYRTRLFSFLENGYSQLDNFYSRIQADLNPQALSASEVKAFIDKRNIIQANLNNASQRLVDELKNNSEKLKNTLAYKDQEQKNNNAKPLSEAAKVAAEKIINPQLILSELTTSLSNGKINQATQYFSSTISRVIDDFIAEAKKADASQEAIAYSQSILDELTDFRDSIILIAKYNPELIQKYSKEIATIINKIESKSSQIRQLWANEVLTSLREASNGTVYILPKSLSAVEVEMVDKELANYLQEQEASPSEPAPVQQIEFSLKDLLNQ